MGWGRTLLLGDVGNRLDIEDCESAIRDMKRAIDGSYRVDRSQDAKLRRLESENDELKLYLSALVRLLMSKDVLTRDELATFVDLIDAEDGCADGKYSGQI